MTTTTEQLAEGRNLELVIGGMTCASCAARIEKVSNSLRLRRFSPLTTTPSAMTGPIPDLNTPGLPATSASRT